MNGLYPFVAVYYNKQDNTYYAEIVYAEHPDHAREKAVEYSTARRILKGNPATVHEIMEVVE